MKKIRKITAKIAVLTLLLSIIPCSFAGDELSDSSMSDEESKILQTIKDKLQTTFKQLKVQDFRESPIAGIYEIVTTNQVMYYYPEKSYMIFGQIYSEDGRSLTEESKSRIQVKKINQLDLSTALTIGYGDKEIIEFTDPSCPYCKKLHASLKGKESLVTRKIIFSPITQLHPDAIQKAVHIMCSKDKAQAMDDIMTAGVSFLDMLACDEGKAIVREHMKISSEFGVEGTPTTVFDNAVIQGFDKARIMEYINN